jgi:hypothetical protein
MTIDDLYALVDRLLPPLVVALLATVAGTMQQIK